MSKLEEAKARLTEAMPHIRLAVEMARVSGFERTGKEPKVELGILSVDEGGAGAVVARFGAEFLKDVAVLLGVDEFC